MKLEELAGKRVAVPGLRTTAHLVLRLLVDHATNGGSYQPVEVKITPLSGPGKKTK